MKVMQRSVTASASYVYGYLADKVLKDLRQLNSDLDELYDRDPDLADELDLDSLSDEVRAALMFVAHELED